MQPHQHGHPHNLPPAPGWPIHPAMVTVGFEIPLFRIVRSMGIVRGLVVRSPGFGGGFIASFEALGMNRVTFVTDLLNMRSQAAIAKLGAVREGVLRAHMITQGGRLRDSVIFSITAAEWPAAKQRLVDRLAS